MPPLDIVAPPHATEAFKTAPDEMASNLVLSVEDIRPFVEVVAVAVDRLFNLTLSAAVIKPAVEVVTAE